MAFLFFCTRHLVFYEVFVASHSCTVGIFIELLPVRRSKRSCFVGTRTKAKRQKHYHCGKLLCVKRKNYIGNTLRQVYKYKTCIRKFNAGFTVYHFLHYCFTNFTVCCCMPSLIFKIYIPAGRLDILSCLFILSDARVTFCDKTILPSIFIIANCTLLVFE